MTRGGGPAQQRSGHHVLTHADELHRIDAATEALMWETVIGIGVFILGLLIAAGRGQKKRRRR